MRHPSTGRSIWCYISAAPVARQNSMVRQLIADNDLLLNEVIIFFCTNFSRLPDNRLLDYFKIIRKNQLLFAWAMTFSLDHAQIGSYSETFCSCGLCKLNWALWAIQKGFKVHWAQFFPLLGWLVNGLRVTREHRHHLRPAVIRVVIDGVNRPCSWNWLLHFVL